MEQEERNKRKQKWMAHGFGIALGLRNTSDTIYSIINEVSKHEKNEFEAFSEVIQNIETLLHECQIATFTEKYMLFQLAEAELKSDSKTNL